MTRRPLSAHAQVVAVALAVIQAAFVARPTAGGGDWFGLLICVALCAGLAFDERCFYRREAENSTTSNPPPDAAGVSTPT